MDSVAAAYDGDVQMIDSTSVRARQQAATAKSGVQILVSVARGVTIAGATCPGAEADSG